MKRTSLWEMNERVMQVTKTVAERTRRVAAWLGEDDLGRSREGMVKGR